MTEQELNRLHYLYIEIKRLYEEIAKLEGSDYSSPCLTDMPSGSGVSDPTGRLGARLADRKALLKSALARAEVEAARLERFIASIDDGETRLIIRLRHINSFTWAEIGEELHMHRTTVKRKYYKFLKVAHNAH